MPNTTLDWINERFHSSLTEENLNSVNDFLLLWSLFEKQICNNDANNNCLLRFAERDIDLFDIVVINRVYDYLRNRYIQNGHSTNRFQYLRLPNQRYIDYILETFLNPESTQTDKLKVSLLIIYRFRNNLFHGEKNILTIDSQTENFRHSNELLKNIIERKMA